MYFLLCVWKFACQPFVVNHSINLPAKRENCFDFVSYFPPLSGPNTDDNLSFDKIEDPPHIGSFWQVKKNIAGYTGKIKAPRKEGSEGRYRETIAIGQNKKNCWHSN